MLVFAYGTLKRNHGNHGRMVDAGGKFVAEDTIAGGVFAMHNLGAFPGLVPNPDGGRIYGEVFEVTDLAPLDRLEGYPHFYDRKTIITEDGRKCLVYFLRYSNDPIVTGGNWTARLDSVFSR